MRWISAGVTAMCEDDVQTMLALSPRCSTGDCTSTDFVLFVPCTEEQQGCIGKLHVVCRACGAAYCVHNMLGSLEQTALEAQQRERAGDN